MTHSSDNSWSTRMSPGLRTCVRDSAANTAILKALTEHLGRRLAFGEVVTRMPLTTAGLQAVAVSTPSEIKPAAVLLCPLFGFEPTDGAGWQPTRKTRILDAPLWLDSVWQARLHIQRLILADREPAPPQDLVTQVRELLRDFADLVDGQAGDVVNDAIDEATADIVALLTDDTASPAHADEPTSDLWIDAGWRHAVNGGGYVRDGGWSVRYVTSHVRPRGWYLDHNVAYPDGTHLGDITAQAVITAQSLMSIVEQTMPGGGAQ